MVNDTRIDRHHGCTRVMVALERLIASIGGDVIYRLPAHRDWRADPAFVSAMGAAKLVLINGEGTIHHDRPAGKMLLLAAAQARAHGVPVALVNAGWEENGAEITTLLDNVDLVSVRDSRSAAALREMGKTCRIVPDLSLVDPVEPIVACRVGVGFTDSVDRDMTLLLDRCRRDVNGIPVSIQYGASGLISKAHFLRQAISRAELVNPSRIAGLLRSRAAMWGAQVKNADHFVQQLGSLEMLVSGRFHACTLALLAGTPFIAVPSNTAKIAALVEDAGLEMWRADALLDANSVTAARASAWSAAERASVADYIESARRRATELFADIGQLLR